VMELSAGTEQFTKAAAAIKQAADGALRTELTTALRDIAKPFGQYILLAGAAELPKKGGLSYRVAGSSITTDTSTTFRATITFRNNKIKGMSDLDNGVLWHPTFGHKPQVKQTLRTGLFSTPFAEDIGQIRTALVDAANKVLRK